MMREARVLVTELIVLHLENLTRAPGNIVVANRAIECHGGNEKHRNSSAEPRMVKQPVFCSDTSLAHTHGGRRSRLALGPAPLCVTSPRIAPTMQQQRQAPGLGCGMGRAVLLRGRRGEGSIRRRCLQRSLTHGRLTLTQTSEPTKEGARGNRLVGSIRPRPLSLGMRGIPDSGSGANALTLLLLTLLLASTSAIRAANTGKFLCTHRLERLVVYLARLLATRATLGLPCASGSILSSQRLALRWRTTHRLGPRGRAVSRLLVAHLDL